MNRQLTKIIAVILAVIILPLFIFTIYQLNSISENEEVLQEVYSNQLETILFSLNQHSDDVVSSWAGEVERAALNGGETSARLKQLTRDFPPVEAIILQNQGASDSIISSPGLRISGLRDKIENALNANKGTLRRLSGYLKSSYRKIEGLPLEGEDNHLLLVFFIKSGGEESLQAGILINKQSFISEVISRRIARSAGDKFTIVVISDRKDSIVYSNSPVNIKDIDKKRELWSLKGYSLGISLKGETLKNLVNERSKRNLYILILINLLFVTGIIIVIINIRKQMQLAQIKSDFVSNVSHELRTPLALITMFSETLEAGRVKSEEKVKEYYRIISAEANRLSKIVNSILNFSQIESGKRKYSFKETDLNELVRKVTDTYTFHLQNKGFRYEALLSDNLPKVNADPEALSEALINLLDNAIKYSADVKEITVATGVKVKNVFVSVKDSGIGIAESEKKIIFDKFYRVTSGLTHNTKGTGLGLTIVKHIVDAHKGKIEVKSEPGKGSEFIIYLPAL